MSFLQRLRHVPVGFPEPSCLVEDFGVVVEICSVVDGSLVAIGIEGSICNVTLD